MGVIRMEFKATAMTMDDVLRLKRKYIIPRFQREYSWDTDELTTLYEDLIENLTYSNNKLKASEYFVGSLVLVGDEDNATDIQRFVVDGQQRLTTFTIMFSVIAQKFRELREDKLADVTHSNIIGEDNDGQPLTKLDTETPKPFFQYRVQKKDIDFDVIPRTDEEKKILAAYNFFDRKLIQKNFLTEIVEKYSIDSLTYLDALKAFRDQILNCKVIYVTVKSFEDAYMIFEVLNAKGKNLAPIDIIKNYIFSILTDEAPLDIASDKWKKIRTQVSERGNVDLSVFYRHFWLSKYKFITNKKLVSEFNKVISKDITSYTSFLNDLENASIDYGKISTPVQTEWMQPEDITVYYALHAFQIFNVTQIRSFLMALFDCKTKDLVSHKDYIKALDFLEYFHFIFTAVSSTRSSGLERRYSSFARKLRACPTKNECRRCINDLIIAMKESLPDYSIFEKNLQKISYTTEEQQSKKLVQYILYKIERYYTCSFELQPASVTIEHILPESTRTPYVGFIGNLLPLGESINSRLSNKPYSEKIKLYNNSQFLTVKEFVKENKDKTKWTKKDIEDRTKALANILYYKVWNY